MRKTLTVLIALAMLSIFLPGIQAHTATAGYDLPSEFLHAGPVDAGTGRTTRFCSVDWDDWDEGLIWDHVDEELFGDPDDNPDDNYVGPALGLAFSSVCQPLRAARDRGDDGAVNIGVFSGGIEAPTDSYTTFVAAATDENFDATYFLFCITTQHSDGLDDRLCEENDPDTPDYYNSGCGTVVTETDGLLAGGPKHHPYAYIYAVHLDTDTLEPCFASGGVLSVTMSSL